MRGGVVWEGARGSVVVQAAVFGSRVEESGVRGRGSGEVREASWTAIRGQVTFVVLQSPVEK